LRRSHSRLQREYVRRIVLEAGATIAAMGGLDVLVFSGGVGENSTVIRRRVCEALGWIGVALDLDANERHAWRLDRIASAVTIRRVEVDEEAVIGRAVAAALTQKGPA
jgi:acetate kinase